MNSMKTIESRDSSHNNKNSTSKTSPWRRSHSPMLCPCRPASPSKGSLCSRQVTEFGTSAVFVRVDLTARSRNNGVKKVADAFCLPIVDFEGKEFHVVGGWSKWKMKLQLHRCLTQTTNNKQQTTRRGIETRGSNISSTNHQDPDQSCRRHCTSLLVGFSC